MRSSAAETLGLKALAFLAADPDALTRFLGLSGTVLEDLRTRADDPLLLAAVLDFVLTDDGLLVAFAEAEGVDPRSVHEARRALPGATPYT